ncbi:MAG: DUF1838 family protein [Rhodospirillaceae bacterium]|nr:DUF1838 family protein [Rhodospirillaceae bacterium]
MFPAEITRRGVLTAGTALASAAVVLPIAIPKSASAAVPKFDHEDPKERARFRARIVGSSVEEHVHSYTKLHIYGYMNDGNMIPFFTLLNYAHGFWKPLPDGTYDSTMFESGVYCTFGTEDPLDVWENPITGEKREVWQFLGGPLKVKVGPEGAVTDENATVKPQPMTMEIIGDYFYLPQQSSFKFPNPLSPEKYPNESPGKMFFWDSHFTYSVPTADLIDQSTPRVRAAVQYVNMVTWHPWLGMGNRPGKTIGRAYGAKLKSYEDVPPGVRKAIEAKTPEVLNTAGWTKFRDDIGLYIEQRIDKKG